MDYRVDEVGALIFRPKDEGEKVDLVKVLEDIANLKNSISKLEIENKTLKKEIEEIKKGMTIWGCSFFI